MKRSGLIHSGLAGALTGLRHTDTFVVADSGLPVPPGPEVIDLGIRYGLPGLFVVLEPVLAEVEVERCWMSTPVAEQNPDVHRRVERLLSPELIEHDEFKRRVGDARLVVRTGEATPYANVLLRAGVPW